MIPILFASTEALTSASTSNAGIIISAISAFGAAYAVYASRAKVRAEAEHFTVDSANQLVATVMRQLDYLDGEVSKLRKTIDQYRRQVEEAARTEERLSLEIRTLRRNVRTLVEFIEDHGLEPPPDINVEV